MVSDIGSVTCSVEPEAELELCTTSPVRIIDRAVELPRMASPILASDREVEVTPAPLVEVTGTDCAKPLAVNTRRRKILIMIDPDNRSINALPILSLNNLLIVRKILVVY